MITRRGIVLVSDLIKHGATERQDCADVKWPYWIYFAVLSENWTEFRQTCASSTAIWKFTPKVSFHFHRSKYLKHPGMKWSGWGSEVLWPCWKKSIWRTEEKIPGAERNSEDPWSWFGFVQKHCTWVKSVLCSYFSSCWTPGILLCLQITSVIASFSFKPFGLVFQIGIMYIISDAILIQFSAFSMVTIKKFDFGESHFLPTSELRINMEKPPNV